MSPEQISGKEVTKKSDIYALGLLLYEIFTGKQAFTADTIPGLLEKQKNSQPTNPSEIVTGIDPMVEDLISKCLNKEPVRRPASALHVAMALPGGNPLQAALEAGETPTPEMIAAAPSKGALKPLAALALLLGFIGTFSLLMYWSSIYGTNAYVPLNDSPEVLAKKAQTVTNNLGYSEPPVDWNYRFYYDKSYLEYAKEQKNPREVWEKVRKGQPLVYYFQYRQSPKYLTPNNLNDRIDENTPPLTEPGMINLDLDPKGRLIKFAAVPTIELGKAEERRKTNWKKLFDEAGLDISRFKEIRAKQRPPVFADEITGFEGTMADHPDIPVRIEAAGYQGKAVYFNVVPSWKESASAVRQKIEEASQSNFFSIISLILLLSALSGSFLLARYNLKKGRSDLLGATKIAVFLFVVLILNSALSKYGTTSVPTGGDKILLFFETLPKPVLVSFFIFVAYLAIEPFFRRRLSDMFISWNRLIAGDFRNPMIGRDILMGITLSAGIIFINSLIATGKSYVNFVWINEFFFNGTTGNLNGFSKYLFIIPNGLVQSIVGSFMAIFFILVFSLIFKQKWKSILAVMLLFGVTAAAGQVFQEDWAGVVSTVFIYTVGFFILLRFGLVAFAASAFVQNVIDDLQVTFNTSSFYFSSTILLMLVIFGIAICAYYISTAGKPLFGKGFLEEGG
jgi:serine/threonine-protein kinase